MLKQLVCRLYDNHARRIPIRKYNKHDIYGIKPGLKNCSIFLVSITIVKCQSMY